VDLASYAELSVQLVNTRTADEDRLGDLDGLRTLLAAGPRLHGRAARADLDAMRELRTDLRAIFEAVASDHEHEAADRLNALLIQHPVHPQISGHDGERWHLHVTESGSIFDQYAAGAAMGLALFVSAEGLDRLAVCAASACRNVFFDTSSNRSREYCSDRCAGRTESAEALAQRCLSRSDGRGQ
jgi:predicted RNA-binding Zn ribbon-like protein